MCSNIVDKSGFDSRLELYVNYVFTDYCRYSLDGGNGEAFDIKNYEKFEIAFVLQENSFTLSS